MAGPNEVGPDRTGRVPEETVAALVRLARRRPPSCGRAVVLAVDGPSGSGKTTLGRQLAASLDATLMHMDDLYQGWDDLADSPTRLEQHLLAPLSRGERTAYRSFDWGRDEPGEWHEVRVPGGFLVVEGAGSSADPAASHVAVAVWLEAGAELRRTRALHRDGETYRPHWERWAAQERELFGRDRTRERADVVIDTTPGAGGWSGAVRGRDHHDPMTSHGHWRDLGTELAPELGHRAAQRSRRSLRERVDRLRHRWFFIVQCAVAAAGAWWFARYPLGHPQPFFAPIAAIVCLGFSFGQRLRRVVELMAGVAVGVLVGDVFVQLVGNGVWQIIVVTIAAMAVGGLLGAGTLITTQAGVQSVLVVTLVASPGYALSRWLDAVVGGLVALLVATVAPAAPLRRPREQTSRVARDLAASLRQAADGLRRGDVDTVQDALERARATDDALAELEDLAGEGIAVVRLSPFRRRGLPAVQAIAALLTPLGRTIRNIRVLVGRAVIAVRQHEGVPPPYTDLLDALADVLTEIADELQQRRLPEGVREPLVEIARHSARVFPRTTLSAEVLRGQVQAIVLELLALTGLSYEEARDLVPASADLEEALRAEADEREDEQG